MTALLIILLVIVFMGTKRAMSQAWYLLKEGLRLRDDRAAATGLIQLGGLLLLEFALCCFIVCSRL
jgi:hypothetical protein